MRKKILTTMAIMIAITFTAPSIFAAPLLKYIYITPDRSACFYDSATGDFISIITKRVGNVIIPGEKLKMAQANGFARIAGDYLFLTGTVAADKARYKTPAGRKALIKENFANLAGSGYLSMRSIRLHWSTDTYAGPSTSIGVYNPATDTSFSYPLTKINCRDLLKK